MDAFLADTFEGVLAGSFTRNEFVEHLAYALTALDIGNRSEAVLYFKTGMRRFRGAAIDHVPPDPHVCREPGGVNRSNVSP